jgi:hypothetical protein
MGWGHKVIKVNNAAVTGFVYMGTGHLFTQVDNFESWWTVLKLYLCFMASSPVKNGKFPGRFLQ